MSRTKIILQAVLKYDTSYNQYLVKIVNAVTGKDLWLGKWIDDDDEAITTFLHISSFCRKLSPDSNLGIYDCSEETIIDE